MRRTNLIACAAMVMGIVGCGSQKTVTKTERESIIVTPTSGDKVLSDNLDLELVASIFGESKDLGEFEKRLNDPEAHVSNLDLNEDGSVDYLRVVEQKEGEIHHVTVQAVIGEEQYQDVCELQVHKTEKEESYVQVVGDPYVYGPGYIIEPIFTTFLMWEFFFTPLYRPWVSPFYWGYYPPYFRPFAPFPIARYHNHVHVNVNVHNHYRHTSVNRNINHKTTNINHRRSDIHQIKKTPKANLSGNHFKSRHPQYNNHRDVMQHRNSFSAPHRSISRAGGGRSFRH